MTFRGTLRRCFVWLLCISLCLGLAVPALAEDAKGSEIRLLQTEGTVNVTSTSGKSYSTREDMRLYNGYVVSTEEASYAWITLDSDKAVKLDQCSSLEVRRSGKTLELLLKSGELFFNVTAPLKEDEKLNIRTSTMVTGVRGTVGWVRQIDLDHSEVGILEGRVICRVVNPDTGASRTLSIKAGEIGDLWIYETDTAGKGAEAQLRRITSMDEISGFILEEILKDPILRRRIEDATGLDFTGLTEEMVADKIAREQEEIRKKLEEIEAKKLEEVISKDPLWEGEKQGDGEGTYYTITWSMLGTEETTRWAAGKTPWHADPYIPEGWAFAGWTPDIEAASKDTTYRAVFWRLDQYEQDLPDQPGQYTVTWVVDGVSTQVVYAENSLPTYEDPVKEGYKFVGWEPPISAVTGDAEYTAVFEQVEPEEYTITWLDEDGETVLDKTSVTAGERPEFPGEQPAKEGYRFIGWEPEVTEAWDDAEYTAVFEELDPEAETAEITWIIDGAEEKETWAIGAIPSHDAPSREPSADLTFVFSGWYDGSRTYAPEEELPAVTGNTTYTAEFSEELRSYTVTWVVDGVSEEETCSYGDTPSHTVPEKEETETTIYRFLGWDDGTNTYAPEELPAVTGDVTYTAKIEEAERTYTITWIDGNGDTLEDQVAYGVTPTYSGPTPTKDEDGDYRYTFNGTWDPEVVPVTEDAEYTARFDETAIYAVTPTPPEKGTLKTDVSTAAEGETVTVTVAANPGYETSEVMARYELDGAEEMIRAEGSDGTYTFTMPAADVTVEAMLYAQSFTLTPIIDPTDVEEVGMTFLVNGAELDPETEEVSTDDVVTLEVTWFNDSYSLDSVIVEWTDETGAAGEPITAAQSGDDVPDADYFVTRTYTFTMPAGNATVTASFRQRYYIESYELSDYGETNVTINGESAETALPGDEVVLTLTPYDNIAIVDGTLPVVTYYDEATDSNVPVSVTSAGANSYSFTMPEGSVNVMMSNITIMAENAVITVSATEGTELIELIAEAEDTAILLTDRDMTLTVNIVPDYAFFIQGYADISDVVPDGTAVTYADGNSDQDATYTFTVSSDTELTFTITGG